MKILIANYEYPPLGGGAGVCSKYHAEGLAYRGHEVSVLTTWFKGEPEFYESGTLKIYRLKSKRTYIHKSNPLEMYSWATTTKHFFSTMLAGNTYDLCLANFAIPGGFVAQYLKKKHGIPYIIISHGQDIPWFFPRQLLLYHSLCYFKIASLLKGSIKNIMLTAEMKASADKLLPASMAKKNVIIPNGCAIEKFKRNESLRSATFHILFIGRLRQQKDPFSFLRAMKILVGKNIPFQATILGDGPMRKRLEHYIRKNGLEHLISISGWVDKEAMLRAYQSASLLISTSKDEGMSIALLEAISTGLYVMATPASGNREMIDTGANGEIFPFSHPEVLAEMITAFYHEKYLNGFSVPSACLENFRQKYAWDRIVDDYHKCIIETPS